ncbi:MAG: acyl-CoA dehydrogenase [Myxococcales bacterium]|nr:acyl-CoA dehydrogenase [Polyangiaceae bacterium]MDW8247706.1 acyl-CoA dehydrogenase [Myxococcales bacterium]
MSTQPQNRYKADLRDFSFLLFEQFKLGELLQSERYSSWSEQDVKMVLSGCYEFACKVTGPLNAVGDQGCQVIDGKVKTPPGFKEAWNKLREAGWRNVGVSPEYGGQGAPAAVQVLVEELLSGSNTAFNMYPGLAYGAGEIIEHFGTPEQKQRYLPRIFSGEWGGTMCLTEPHAGTDVGAARTRATRRPDGRYNISGTKIYISGGDHDMADNIVHLVLARIEGAAPGTKGLSLFIVPKIRVNDDGSLGPFNDVVLGGIEHKMGINGSATCVLNFGENGDCIGELMGTTEHVGMAQMFQMMNGARIAVGIQGVGVASAAYLNALQYAKERKQGPSIQNWKDASAPKVAIIEHPDVRRMLLDMKARVEGIRALAVKLASHRDRFLILRGKEDEKAAYHQGQVELLTPLVKAYGSDQAFRVCETAIQTLGGAGYIKDYGIEQYCRDSKIFSIYEGTNHIQAMDLVGRKMGMQGGMHLMNLISDVGKFVATHTEHPAFSKDIQTLSRAQEAVSGAAMKFMGWFQGGRMVMVPLNANRFLEMMSELVVGWLLLEQGVIAHQALASTPQDHPDHTFYQGKMASARYYARNVLPGVHAKWELINLEDDTPLTIDDASFATV